MTQGLAMRNLHEEAKKVLETSEAKTPAALFEAATLYALRQCFAWWESAFLLDELEKMSGMMLRIWRPDGLSWWPGVAKTPTAKVEPIDSAKAPAKDSPKSESE